MLVNVPKLVFSRQTKRPMSARTRPAQMSPVSSVHSSVSVHSSTSVRSSARAMSAQPTRKTMHERDEEAILKRAMADEAFAHWRKQKDRDSSQK